MLLISLFLTLLLPASDPSQPPSATFTNPFQPTPIPFNDPTQPGPASFTNSTQPPPTNFTDPTLAFQTASATHRNVLLLFAGSDWCIPCIHFEKKILADSAFQSYASTRLVILIADFPQRKKIPDSLRTQYESLAAQFNPDGAFPQIVLLDPSRRLLATLPYTEQSVSQFIGELRNLCKECP